MCVTFLLCDPGWCVRKSDVQNEGDDNTHTLVGLVMSVEGVARCRENCRAGHSPNNIRATSFGALMLADNDKLYDLFLSSRPRTGLATTCILKKNLYAPRPSEHPPVRGKKMSKRLGGINS